MPDAFADDPDRLARFQREAASGSAVDKRSDVWSFGVVLFEMLTGHGVRYES